MTTGKSVVGFALILALIGWAKLTSATPTPSVSIPQSSEQRLGLHLDQIQSCQWRLLPLTLPLQAPNDLISRALRDRQTHHLDLFHTRAQRVNSPSTESIRPKTSDIVWQWSRRFDLSHAQRWLTTGQSLLEHSTSVYALCEITERSTSVTTQPSEQALWYFWASHPFQLWIDGHLLGRSDIVPRTSEDTLTSESSPIARMFMRTR